MYGSANRVSAKAREAIEAGRYHVDEARAEAELAKQRSDSRSAGLKARSTLADARAFGPLGCDGNEDGLLLAPRFSPVGVLGFDNPLPGDGRSHGLHD